MLRAYVVFDQKAEAYLPPFFTGNDRMAIRMVTDAVADKTHVFGRHPEDYTCFCVGEFDEQKGMIAPCNPLLVCNLVEVVNA